VLIVGVDTGGTFTDIIYKDGDAWGVHKLLSTPRNPALAVIAGLKAVCGDRAKSVAHGSTVATNAILERKGVKTAFVTNAGFEDVLDIGRQNRARLYDLRYEKPAPLAPASLRKGLPGRIDAQGRELEPFDEPLAEQLASELKAAGVESVAVSFLFSFLHPEHERAMGRALETAGIPVSLSHEILAEFREYERASTTVINAYVSPKMERYISHILCELGDKDTLRVMQSNGGSISASTAMKESVRTILSGPAGGAVAALELGRQAGFVKLIGFDMGGTSTDVTLIDGALSMTMESSISGLPVKAPMVDIHTVGAGGGSIASIDAGGALRVGPESAGADPGPICYGKGTKITVTDANLFLGRLVPDHFLGGAMQLDQARLQNAFESLAAELKVTPVELAEGVVSVANAAMERAIRVISVERGHDPRGFTLLSFGGAGGLHAVELARMLAMPRVLVPKNPGILSAIGMLLADVLKDYSLTVMRPANALDVKGLKTLFAPLEERGLRDLAAEGADPAKARLERYLDMRYEGQSFEIVTPLNEDYSGDVIESFHALHEKTYGYRNPDKPVELVNIRLRARSAPDKPVFPKADSLVREMPAAAFLDARPVVFNGEAQTTRIIDRDNLLPGNSFEGPAVLVEYSSTILVPPGVRCECDAWGNLVLHLE
jgi:N-methylhydantoinase A